MKIKLNGWQRIGVVLNAIYLIIIIIVAWYEWPTQKQIESSWVYSALDAIRKPESPYAYKLRESRFKDISDRELIKRINLEYNANKVREKMTNIVEMLSDFRNLDKTEQDKVLASNTKVSEMINDFNGLPKIEQDKVLNAFQITDPFIIAQLEGELVTPGEKLAEQCEEKLKEVNLRYQKEIESLGIDRLRIVGISFMAWIIPSGIVYLLCLAIVWIYRGFKENKTSTQIQR